MTPLETKDLAQEMFAYHCTGHNLRQVGEKFDVSKQAISELFQRYGYKVRKFPFSKVGGNLRRQAILDFIAAYRREHGESPTMSQIAEVITGDARNNGNLYRLHISKLIDEGFLYRAREGDRALMLTQPQPRVPYYKKESES